MNTKKMIGGAAVTAAMTMVMANANAATVTIGTNVISTQTQTEALTSGDTFTLKTTVFQNAGEYTYQYLLTNDTDPNGLATFSPTVSSANDFGTSGLTFFFGGDPNPTGKVKTDGPVGDDLTNNILSPIHNGASDTLEAFGKGARIEFSTTTGTIAKGQSNLSEYGDYFYIQSNTGPGSFDINVTDSGSADFQGPAPGAPEPSTVASFGFGGFGLLGLMLRARKASRKTA